MHDILLGFNVRINFNSTEVAETFTKDYTCI